MIKAPVKTILTLHEDAPSKNNLYFKQYLKKKNIKYAS